MIATIFISIILFLIVSLIVWSFIKKKKRGKSIGCGCGCGSCAMGDICHGNKE